MRLIIHAGVLALALALAACAGSTAPSGKSSQRGMTKDIGGVPEEKEFKEVESDFPAYPPDSGLLEFYPRQKSQNRFYVDPNALSIGPDRVIRYSLIVKSPSGALTISYEGLRCKTSEYKQYGFSVTNGEWTKARNTEWRNVPKTASDFRFALYKDYFCDLEAIAGRNERDLIANLAGNPLNNVTDKNR
jgi:hypothetical protein